MNKNDRDLTLWVIKIMSFIFTLWGLIPGLAYLFASNHLLDNQLSVYIGAGSFFISLPLLLLMVHYDNKKEDKKEEEEYFRNLEIDPI